MGYFMRFFVLDDRPVTFEAMAAALHEVDAAYTLVMDAQLDDFAELRYDGVLLAEVEIDAADDEILTEDRDELKTLLAHSQAANKTRVLEVLDAAKGAVVVEAHWQGTDSDPVLSKIDVLWDWLFAEYDGLLQMDGEGFWDDQDLILPMNVKI